MAKAETITTIPSNLSRRLLVTGTAALPALAVPAMTIAAEPDPVFAAIQKYRARDDAFMTRCRHEGELRKAGVKLVSAEGEYGRTAEMIAVVNALIEERWELANAAPTTLPGLVAYLDYLLAEGERLSSKNFPPESLFEDDETVAFIRSLRRTADALAAHK
jgi:hypothetical protein